jgi:tRNA(fMet)-specific endonuclease VapC
MKRYLLDTNACIAWLKRRESVVSQVQAAGSDSILLCPPVKLELWFGACKSGRREENQQMLRDFFSALPEIGFSDEVMQHYGDIRVELERQGTPIGPMDLLISAFARANGLTVVTRNQREFSRVPGLSVENWQDETPPGT